MGLLDKLFLHFASRVTIHCDLQGFIFSGPGGTRTLRTFVCLKLGEKSATLLSVGDEVTGTAQDVIRVDLFSPTLNHRLPAHVTREELVALYVRQGFYLVFIRTPGRPHLRPVVRYINQHVLDGAVGGPSEPMLRQAAIGCGALAVEFDGA